MKPLVCLSTFIVAATLFSGCVPKRIAPNAGRVLVGLDESWAEAAGADDVEAIMAYWTEDAVLYAPTLPPLYGKQAIRDLMEQRRTRPRYLTSWTPSCAGVDEWGGMAYTLGKGTVSLVDESGVPHKVDGRYVAIWRKDDDPARWRCAVKCWTPSPQDPAGDP